MLVPNCHSAEVDVANFESYLDEIVSFLSTDGQHWTVSDITGGDIGLERVLLTQNSGDMSIFIGVDYFEESDNEYHVALDPNGDMSTIEDPAETASDGWSGLRTRSTDSSWFGEGFIEEEMGDRMVFWETEDAIFLSGLWEDGSYWHSRPTIMTGHLMKPINQSIEDFGVDGHCVLFGTSDHYFFSRYPSCLRLQGGIWHEVGENKRGGDLLDNMVPSPLIFYDSDDNTGFLGVSKYIFHSNDIEPTRSVLPSLNSDQGWLHCGDGNTRFLVLWDKHVTP